MIVRTLRREAIMPASMRPTRSGWSPQPPRPRPFETASPLGAAIVSRSAAAASRAPQVSRLLPVSACFGLRGAICPLRTHVNHDMWCSDAERSQNGVGSGRTQGRAGPSGVHVARLQKDLRLVRSRPCEGWPLAAVLITVLVLLLVRRGGGL
jgi:hypothetical protein